MLKRQGSACLPPLESKRKSYFGRQNQCHSRWKWTAEALRYNWLVTSVIQQKAPMRRRVSMNKIDIRLESCQFNHITQKKVRFSPHLQFLNFYVRPRPHGNKLYLCRWTNFVSTPSLKRTTHNRSNNHRRQRLNKIGISFSIDFGRERAQKRT